MKRDARISFRFPFLKPYKHYKSYERIIRIGLGHRLWYCPSFYMEDDGWWLKRKKCVHQERQRRRIVSDILLLFAIMGFKRTDQLSLSLLSLFPKRIVEEKDGPHSKKKEGKEMRYTP